MQLACVKCAQWQQAAARIQRDRESSVLSDVTVFYCFGCAGQERVGIPTAQYWGCKVVLLGKYVAKTAAQVGNVAFCMCLYMLWCFPTLELWLKPQRECVILQQLRIRLQHWRLLCWVSVPSLVGNCLTCTVVPQGKFLQTYLNVQANTVQVTLVCTCGWHVRNCYGLETVFFSLCCSHCQFCSSNCLLSLCFSL